MARKTHYRFLIGLVALISIYGCDEALPQTLTPTPDRESLIPPGQAKITPETDVYIPISTTDEYEDPLPLPYPVNTRGAEDSAFITPDGGTLYVWFTPDVSKPPEKQVIDGVTGIYLFHKIEGGWSSAERVMLQDPGKLALDGCEFVLGDTMWFCTAREGYTGLHWFTATYREGRWGDWQQADFKPEYEVGELHITADGQELYFHSARPGGLGGYDLWLSRKVDGEWGPPVNLASLNSPGTDGWPFVTQDGTELWFTRGPGGPELWRSKRVKGEWGPPEQMFTNFAGEASLDLEGNVYFTHHFYKDDRMLEADIYMARKRVAIGK
jgi:hypothetical protein